MTHDVNSSLISDPHEDHADLYVPPADGAGDPCLHLNRRLLSTSK